MVKKIRCTTGNGDGISVDPYTEEKEICLNIFLREGVEYIFLTPTDARKLRKQIKKVLEAIEGVDQKPTAETNTIKYSVGDNVRIIGNKYPTDNRDEFGEYSGHNFQIGELAKIVEIDINDEDRPYNCGGAYGWVTAEDIEPA